MNPEELAQLRREAEAELKKHPEVVAVSYGFKSVGGITTNQLAFCVYVIQKKKQEDLKPEDILPKEFRGIPLDVLEVPEIVPLHCVDMQHYDPLISGITVTNIRKDAQNNVKPGTLGFFATINGASGPENVVLVSNHHVLMANGAGTGDKVYQPASIETNGQITTELKDDYDTAKIHNVGLDDVLQYDYHDGAGPLFLRVDCTSAKLNMCISSWCDINCGVKFKNAIRLLNINNNSAIKEIARVRDSDLDPNRPYIVFKVGRQSGLTVGKVVSAMALTDRAGLGIKIEAISMDTACKQPGQPDVFSVEGDSGAAIINEQNQLVGILFGADHNDPKISYACHIHPVLEVLKVTPITQANPHSAASTLSNRPGVIGDGTFDHTPQLREKFLNTDKGQEILPLVLTHRQEVVHLVNHRRPVTVSWHRSKGPLFISHLMNSARDPEHVVPREIDGVDRETLVRNMARVLSVHGSAELKGVVERYFDDVLSYIDKFDNLHELVEQFLPVSQRE